MNRFSPPTRLPVSVRCRGWLLLLLLPALGCGGGGEARELSLRREVVAGSYAVGDACGAAELCLPGEPVLEEVTVDHQRRLAVVTPAGRWRWRGRVPAGARLGLGAQATAGTWAAGLEELEVVAAVRAGRAREILEVGRLRRREGGEPPSWLDLALDLSAYGGREVTLEVDARPAGPPAALAAAALAWGPVALTPPPAAIAEAGPQARRPNVLFILIDTLRHDRLTPYGYARDTTPRIRDLLAEPGAVVEEAYSQASWTLPSVVSFMTGRPPGELLREGMASYGIPAAVTPLAERLAALGYETGGFFANPTLHAGNGFARGFATFFAPPADLEWLHRHADDLNARAVPWLRVHQHRPFFAYVHYIDPHDPYDNPDVVDGRSPYYPDYPGTLSGRWAHGVYTGRIPLTDPERDIAHLSALYDTEVHYVDRHVGELIETLEPAVLANTLVVLTSDHGEELYDHGGWKHGQTLYEEQIHVPLIVRWDGRVPAGTRLGGTVRLLDLAPTLMAAVEGEADPAWRGVNLLPALTGEGPLPRRPAFAQHMSAGPLRAAAVLDGKKLIFFDRGTPFAPPDDLQAFLWRQDMARLAARELYDLERDPHEKENLYAAAPETAAALAPAIHRQLDRQLEGLRVVAGGLPAGSRLGGTIVLDRPPAGWSPYFLEDEDRVEIRGSRVNFELTGGAGEKGFLLRGDFAAVERVGATLDGIPLEAEALLLGPGRPAPEGPIPAAALEAEEWPVAPEERPSLRLWHRRAAAAEAGESAEDEETRRRLRALGYIQ